MNHLSLKQAAFLLTWIVFVCKPRMDLTLCYHTLTILRLTFHHTAWIFWQAQVSRHIYYLTLKEFWGKKPCIHCILPEEKSDFYSSHWLSVELVHIVAIYYFLLYWATKLCWWTGKLIKLINNSWWENKGNLNREGGLDMWSYLA